MLNRYQFFLCRLWKSYGCKVLVSNADVTSYVGCEELLKSAARLGPVAGIFNLAVVLRDRIFSNQTIDSFRESLAPKAVAMTHLDVASRRLCPDLELFVAFSSIVCGLGNAGQANYGMANAIMERIIEKRLSDNLPAKAIQWGAIGDVGAAYKLKNSVKNEQLVGYLFQSIHNCLNTMDILLTSGDPLVASFIVAQKVQVKRTDPLSTVLNLLGIKDIKNLSINSTMSDLGMDSLTNVEIKQIFERDFDIVLSADDLRALTLSQLIELSAKSESSTKPAPNPVDQPVDVPQDAESLPKFLRHLGDEKHKDVNILKVNSVPDDGNVCVLFIPGVEAVVNDNARNLCAKLKLPTYALQYQSAWKNTTSKEIVAHLSKVFAHACMHALHFGTRKSEFHFRQ